MFCGEVLSGQSYPTAGSVERLDPRMNQLVPKGAKIEVLAEGYVLVRRSGLGIPGRLSALFGRTHQQSLQVEGRRGSKRLFESVRIHGEKPEGRGIGIQRAALGCEGKLDSLPTWRPAGCEDVDPHFQAEFAI